ncbi:MAG: putative bifunctional diguanylate cyclase/phosphodiesterase, partial [Acidimicrobiales bacterium]
EQYRLQPGAPPMEYSPADLQRFETLLTDVATRLMSVGNADAGRETASVLAELVEFFAVDNVFLRRHDPQAGRSNLVAIQPALQSAAANEAIASVGFDDDPVYAMSEDQDRPLIFPPGRSADRDRWLREATGAARVTLATVPLIHGTKTVGILGVVDRTNRSWHDHDLRTLSAIGSLFAHLWGRLEAERRLAHQVYHDDLTGLANRRKLTEVIDALPDDRQASLLAIDIDNMNVINDGLDFETGNRFIEGLSKRLVSIVRPTGTVARLSDDQFAVLAVDTPPGHVERLGHRLVKEMGETVRLDDEVGVARSVSIGVAHNHVAETNRELLAEAEAALYEAKRAGKQRMAVFDEQMRARVIDGFGVEIELRRAIDRDELTLHYQPEVDLDTGEICAVEALLRWHHPDRGLLTAGAFIETAEESGLVVEIGDQVLRRAIGQLARWHQDHPDLEMWINVSPAQLMSRDVATQIQTLLAEFEVRPDRICLEVTEHVVLGDLDATTGILRRLRDMGIKLALDDFGTGYSSMKQLKHLPITALKIDMAFVAGLGISDHDSAIVDAAINLAAAFDLGTVAEGVETQQQITELRKRGCHTAQGFLLARPAGPDQISEMLGNPLEIDQLVEL